MSTSSNALVLPPDRASTAEAQTFPGFPGAYQPGVPVLLATIGLDLMEARSLISDLGLPLVEHEHEGDEEPAVPDANPPRLEGNAAFDSGVGAPEQPGDTDEHEPEVPLEKRTKPELVEYAAALDPPLELDEKSLKDELLAAIAEHLLPPATTPPPQPPGESAAGGSTENDGGAA